ncbi:class I SAM-dependent methyltransferase [Candidatus Poribacteria bacterium]|nr:class I SAM-dependent methyltransferase [Candidatus Poribacteria bacterium]
MWDAEYVSAEMPGDEATRDEVDFLVEALDLQSDDRVLDVGCGAGRHAMLLAEYGYRVVGVDASEPLIQAAAHSRKPDGPCYALADMRALPFDGAFDVAICMFASFGLLDDSGNQRALDAMAGALNPDGYALIETWNPYAAAHLDGRRNWWRAADAIHLASARFDAVTGTVLDTRDVLANGGKSNRQWVRSLRLYTPPELTAMASRVGMAPVRWYGDFDGSDLSAASPRLIVAMERVPT